MFPQVEPLLIEWAKANTNLAAIHGGRVASRLPNNPPLPFLTVFRVTGSPEVGLPIDQAFVQWDAYAGTAGATPDYGVADVLALTLINELRAAENLSTSFGWLYGATVLDYGRVEADDLRWARYRIGALVTTRETP